MNSSRLRILAVALVPAMALAATLVPAHADSATGKSRSDVLTAVVSKVVANAADLAAVESYWTPQRRARALPMDAVSGADSPVERRTAARRRSDAVPAGREVPVPRSVGKLFFSDADADYVCSATAIAAPGRDQVLTAGHCVHTGPNASGSPLPILGGLFFQPHFFENWMFVPRYRNGSEPLGRWVGTEVHVSRAWTDEESFVHDQAIIEVARAGDGDRLGDAVGMSRIAIGLARVQKEVRAWGWPAEAPYDGETAWRCDGRTRAISGGDAVLPCSMNGGASGGPWFVEKNVRTKRGVVLRPLIWAVTSRRFLNSPKLIAAPLPPQVRTLRRVAAR